MMKKYKLKKNVKLTLLQLLALISLFICYYLSTIIDNLTACSLLWLLIVFIIPSIIFMIQLLKEYKHEQ